MREVSVVLSDVIDEHVHCRFYLKSDHGRRSLGSLVVHCTELWMVEHMIESAARSAEVGAVLDSLQQDVTYRIYHPGGL